MDVLRRTSLLALAVVFCLSLGTHTQETQQPQESQGSQTPDEQEPPQPIFRTGINFVRVDVIVTDGKGQPVTDLGPEDFEVREDGALQTIESFRLIEVTGRPDPAAEPPRRIRSERDEEREALREDTRLFVVFFDDYHVRRGASMAVRDPLIDFIENLSPMDMVGVMYPLTPLSDVRLTRNHASVINVINQFFGRKFDYTPRNQYEDQYAMYPAEVVERIRNQVSLSGLRAIVTRLGSLREGRKSVIVVSEGYTNALPPQLRDQVAGFRGLGNPNAGFTGGFEDSPMEETARFFAEADMQRELRRVYDTANKANTSLYTLDPRGLGSFGFDISERVSLRTDQEFLRMTQDTLRVLAEQTDGRAIVNRNDMAGALRQVVRDASAYYLLGYNSADAPDDGEFHPIQVEVKRRGLQVRARTGYWALTPEETERALAPPEPGPDPAVTEALGDIAAPRSGRVTRTWIGTGRGMGGKTRVTFVWEPLPPVAGARGEPAARVALMVAGSDGQSYFRGRVPDVTLASAQPALSRGTGSSGAQVTGPSQVTFDADPGQIQLRISVEGADGQVLDNSVEQLMVPDFTTPQVALSTPVVLRARNLVEMRSLVADSRAVPSPGREFHRSERMLVRFEIYGPGTELPTVSAALLSRGGDHMVDLTLSSVPGLEGTHQVEVPLAGLAPGDYLVEVTTTAESGNAKDLVAFRVVG